MLIRLTLNMFVLLKKAGVMANNIKELVKKKQWLLAKVADEAGIDTVRLSRIVNNKSEPTLELARKISKVLGEKLDVVFPENSTSPIQKKQA